MHNYFFNSERKQILYYTLWFTVKILASLKVKEKLVVPRIQPPTEIRYFAGTNQNTQDGNRINKVNRIKRPVHENVPS